MIWRTITEQYFMRRDMSRLERLLAAIKMLWSPRWTLSVPAYRMNLDHSQLSVQRALYGTILSSGSQCLSQASVSTGYGIKELECARDALVERGVIRSLARGDRPEEFVSYVVARSSARHGR